MRGQSALTNLNSGSCAFPASSRQMLCTSHLVSIKTELSQWPICWWDLYPSSLLVLSVQLPSNRSCVCIYLGHVTQIISYVKSRRPIV